MLNIPRWKRVRRSLFLSMLMALSLPVLAQAELDTDERSFRRGPGSPHRGADRKPGPGRFIDEYGDELGLEVATVEEIQAIADESRLRAEGLHQTTRAEQEKLRALLSRSSPDEAAVMAQSDRIEALKSEQRKNRLEAMLAIRKLLTSEQREQLSGMREGNRPGRGRGAGSRRGFVEDGGEAGPRKRRGGRMGGCRDDIAQLCPAAETGRERLQCLSGEWDNLSAGCRAAFEGRGRRGTRDDRGGQPPPE